MWILHKDCLHKDMHFWNVFRYVYFDILWKKKQEHLPWQNYKYFKNFTALMRVLIQKIMPQKWTIKLQINLWPALKPTEAF